MDEPLGPVESLRNSQHDATSVLKKAAQSLHVTWFWDSPGSLACLTNGAGGKQDLKWHLKAANKRLKAKCRRLQQLTHTSQCDTPHSALAATRQSPSNESALAAQRWGEVQFGSAGGWRPVRTVVRASGQSCVVTPVGFPSWASVLQR